MSPEAKETKAKMNYWDFIKIKSFCTAKDIVDKTDRQPIGREIFTNFLTDKGLLSKIYKELTKSTPKEQIIQSRNGQKTLIDISPKKTYK